MTEFANPRVVDYPSVTDKYRGIPITLGSTVAAAREITLFDVLTLLLERATGKPLDELFQERIFDPLKMESACFYCGEENVHRLVTDHAWNLEGNLIVRDPPETAEKVGRSNRKLMSGNGMFGGMLASPPDYARFAQMLLSGGKLDGVRIISRKTVDYMTTNHIGDGCCRARSSDNCAVVKFGEATRHPGHT